MPKRLLDGLYAVYKKSLQASASSLGRRIPCMATKALAPIEKRYPRSTIQRGWLTDPDRKLEWLQHARLDANVVACRLGECPALVARVRSKGATSWFCCEDHRLEYGRRRKSLQRCIQDATKLLAQLEGYEVGTAVPGRASTARGRQIEADLKWLKGVALGYGPLDERAAKVAKRSRGRG